MSDVRELIAMFATHGVDPEKIYGGEPDLVAQDVAAAMARLCPTANYLLRVKYAGEMESYSRLWSCWFRALMDKWGAQNGMVDTIATHSLREHIGSNRCPDCNGTQSAQVGNKVLVCATCAGTGYLYSKQQYGHPWDGRLDWCRGKLAQIETNALMEVSARLTSFGA